MQWRENVSKLSDVATQLAFKPELLEELNKLEKKEKPTQLLANLVSVMRTVALQNKRVADLHSYVSLEMHASNVEEACTVVLDELKTQGIAPVVLQASP